jgi:hypothetical protein
MTNEIINVSTELRLVPVVDVPIKHRARGHATIDRFIHLGSVHDVAVLRELTLAICPRIKEGIIPTALDGGYCLIDAGSVLIEPQCCGDLGDLHSWAAAVNTASQSDQWIRLWIGHPQLLAFPKGQTVWLSLDDDSDSSPPQPAHWAPIYNVPVSALRRAVAQANEVLNGVARPLDQSLVGLVKDDLRVAAVDQLLHGTGIYQVLVKIESILRKTIHDMQQGRPDYESMDPDLQGTIREHLQAIAEAYRRLGSLQMLGYVGNQNREYLYRAVHENAVVTYKIEFSPSNKIAGLSLGSASP